jgi:hypothetical protein
MSRTKTVAESALSIFVAGYFGYRLYEWFVTGQLWTSSRFNPGRYVSFGSEPIGFLLSVSLDVSMVVIAIVLLLSAIAAE